MTENEDFDSFLGSGARTDFTFSGTMGNHGSYPGAMDEKSVIEWVQEWYYKKVEDDQAELASLAAEKAAADGAVATAKKQMVQSWQAHGQAHFGKTSGEESGEVDPIAATAATKALADAEAKQAALARAAADKEATCEADKVPSFWVTFRQTPSAGR